jgi:hypothetical protein
MGIAYAGAARRACSTHGRGAGDPHSVGVAGPSDYPKSAEIDCSSTAPVDGVEQTVTAGGSSLSYDATSDAYTYVWKTSKPWAAGSCRQLVLELSDGSEHRANFKFK